jgi:hypothetical protein
MKNYSWLLLFALLLSAGCARHYVITLSNGTQLGTKGKPRLHNGIYVFNDPLGRESYVPATRVKEIARAGLASKGPSGATSSH